MSTSPSSQRRCTLLGLPPKIRLRIYEAAGVIVDGNVILAPGGCRDHYHTEPHLTYVRLTYNILQICKVVHSEVKELLCARNTLIVIYEHVDYGLEFLSRLTRAQCLVLASLSIQLHVRVRADKYGDHFELPGDGRLSPARISAWHTVARHILSNTRPGTLRLRLFCDTGYGPNSACSKTTTAVLRAMEPFYGTLKDCELRLGHEPHMGLRAVAMAVASRMKGLDPGLRDDKPFHFFRLPFEVRRHILEYTDLIAPAKEVYWDSTFGFRIPIDFFKCVGAGCDAYVHHPSCFMFCIAGPCVGVTGYICRRLCSGYSSRCQCWTNPIPLLLVNRALYREAIQVLYSCNRVIVFPAGSPGACLISGSSLFLESVIARHGFDYTYVEPPDGYTTRLDVSRFITRHVWPEVLSGLCRVEFVLPGIDPTARLLPSAPCYSDLRFALEHLSNHADKSKLSVVVHIATRNSIVKSDKEWIHRALINFEGDVPKALRAHIELLEPFRVLQGLRRFFVHLEWTWHWSFPHPHIYPNPEPELDAKVNEMETWLEQYVAGSDYNSKAVGKMIDRPSLWLDDKYNSFTYYGIYYKL